ncbi:MAG: DUF3267 domain-containing protein [Solobacterium sp.]|nr:DUF3267 domain-containing protein [Solobacterium sp.]
MSKKEKRTLTAAEKRRLERFEETAENLRQQGYVRHDLTVSIVKANVFSVFLLIPLAFIGYGGYYLVHHTIEFGGMNPLVFFLLMLVLIVVHELIHGISWSFFAPHGFKDIEFGIMMQYLTPYCTCLAPLKKSRYVFGSAMPLIILGILPMIAGIVLRNPAVLLMGIIMADGAAGDIMVIARVLGYKSNAEDIVYMDHPTEAGGVIFER